MSTQQTPTIPQYGSGNSSPRRRSRGPLLALGGLVIAGAVVAGGVHLYHEHTGVSQASGADCEWAQQIVNQAHSLHGTPATIDAWEKKTATLRRAKMDGYLGYKIAQYEGWAVASAKGDTNLPSAKDQSAVAEKANQFCVDAKVKLTFPPIGS